VNFIREFINAALSGRHIGKGIKLTRRGKFKEALNHYKLALVYENRSGAAPNPATREYLARTYTRLGNMKEALAAAEESYKLYKQLNSKNKLVADSMIRVEKLIAGLKSGKTDDINKY
jgi:tetratricopeptide (TPR) repeat protein